MPVEERHDDVLASSSTAVKSEDCPSGSGSYNDETLESLVDSDGRSVTHEFVRSSSPSSDNAERCQLESGEIKEDDVDEPSDESPTVTDADNSTPTTLSKEPTESANAKQNGHGDNDSETEQEADETDGWLDIIGSGDLMKKVLRKGHGVDSRPQRGDVVRLNIAGTLPDGRHVEVGQGVEVTIGDAEVIQGLDLAIPLMELDEVAEIVVKPRLAYGKLGREPDVPSNATITYRVELLAVEDDPEVKGLAYPVRTHIGNRKRERGNFWFGRGEYSCALQCYRKALEFLDEESELATDLTHELKELLENRIKVYNNMAAAQLKIGAFDAALKSVDNVLKVQPSNVKALFRKGKIVECMGETEEAIRILKEALQLEPEAKIIHHELSKLVEKRKAEERTERELYRRMLGQDKQQQAEDDVKKTKNGSSAFGYIKWGFVAGGMTIALASVALYRHFHGI